MSEIKIFFKNKYYRSKFKIRFLLPIMILLILLDLISKIIVQTTMYESQGITFIEPLLNFKYYVNEGMAWGMFDDQKWLVIASATFVTVMVILCYIMVNETKMLIPLLFVIAGSLGNLVGRMWGPRGGVVDFLELGSAINELIPWSRNSIFNIADLYVNVGVVAILVVLVIYISYSIYEMVIKKDELLFEKYLAKESKLHIVKKEFENSKGYYIKPTISWSTYKTNIKTIKKEFADYKKQNKDEKN
ncbi:signal peptidase II [Spiroplasma endosymbiont of Othius punctulatus]|uniref:signal peptidase II n=1 Tax=Spiroplasma endosymbiont of Othius punctulatus TaxID=3066289 RepID=UPI0030D36E86